jgi:HJR/Mrr/RecB family endonuclease
VAPTEIDIPVQILELAIVVAAGSGLTVMVTELDFTQPLEFVSVTVYVVVEVGDTEGLEAVEVNPTGELTHEYVLPTTAVAPTEIDVPVQILAFAIVAAAGSGLTVMVTELDFTQLFEFVSVTVYVVVEVGDTEGLEAVEVNPTGELTQE